MKKNELIEICKDLSRGDFIVIQKKSIRMSKYGSSKKFRPRTVSYPKVTDMFQELKGDYLLTSEGCYYYSKIGSITKV